MKTATKAQIREAAATSTVEVTVVKPARKPRTPKATPFKDMVEVTQAMLDAPIGEAPAAPATEFVGPLAPAKAEKPADGTLYEMPDTIALRDGTRKAAVWNAMANACPGTRAQLIAAAEAAEQEWRKDTKRLEAAKPGAKWFRRFAPVLAHTEAL